SFDENASFDIIAQQIVEQISKEREDFNEQYQAIEKENDNLRSESIGNLETVEETYKNTLNDLNQKLVALEKRCEELDAEKQVLSYELDKRSVEIDQDHSKPTIEKVSSNILRQPFEEVPIHIGDVNLEEERKELEQLRETIILLTNQCAQLDEANRAWQLYHQTQLQDFRSKLHGYLSVDENASFDIVAQQIIQKLSKEQEDLNESSQTIEKIDNEPHLESTNDMESMRESYMNTINELNQELLAMRKQCEDLDAEKQFLINELEKGSVQVNQEQVERNIEKVSLNTMKEPFAEVPIHMSGSSLAEEGNELEQLREAVAFLTNQCTQLDAANQAWQQYQQAQLHIFISKLHDYLPIDENTSFDEIAQEIVDQIIKEREDFNIRYEALEKELNAFRSESNINIESVQPSDVYNVSKLNEELLAIKEAYEKLDAEKQLLVVQLESLSTHTEPKQTIEKVSSNVLREPFEKVPIHKTGITVQEDVEELEQLRDTVVLLTNQCAQLDEANRTWQQTQLDNIRNKLHDYIPIDENISFDNMTKEIIEQIIKDRESFNKKYFDLEKVNHNLRSELTMNIQSIEQSSTDNIDELNQEILILKSQNEELEKINQQLLLEKENLINPLNDRSIVLGHHSALESNIIQEEISEDLEENPELESSSSIPIETEEINKIRSDLALITCQFNQLTQTNQNELDLFRLKLRNWISLSPNSTLDDIAQQLSSQFEQKYNIQTNENHTQTIEASEKIHISTETISIIYDNRQTQIDPIDMINQEIQTESFQQLWSI
ncbi:unnamed protein product, partial [Rotaria sp. Silwood2]